jgi:broad specificity phosphatase PhoE
MEDYPIDAIFASNLLRATLTLSPLLQEQHFGKAERQPWTGTEGGKGYYRHPGRTFKFPNGESLSDVRDRADEA